MVSENILCNSVSFEHVLKKKQIYKLNQVKSTPVPLLLPLEARFVAIVTCVSQLDLRIRIIHRREPRCSSVRSPVLCLCLIDHHPITGWKHTTWRQRLCLHLGGTKGPMTGRYVPPSQRYIFALHIIPTHTPGDIAAPRARTCLLRVWEPETYESVLPYILSAFGLDRRCQEQRGIIL